MTIQRSLLLDEMLSATIAEQLRDRGFDATAVVEDSDLIALPDEDLLHRATQRDRCLVTLNIGDFTVVSARWRADARQHAGLIYVATRTFPQNRAFIGSVVTSLDRMLADGAVPGRGAETFLQHP